MKAAWLCKLMLAAAMQRVGCNISGPLCLLFLISVISGAVPVRLAIVPEAESLRAPAVLVAAAFSANSQTVLGSRGEFEYSICASTGVPAAVGEAHC